MRLDGRHGHIIRHAGKAQINAMHAAHRSQTAKPTPHKSISTIATGNSR